MSKREKIIGIIGGMGPEAGVIMQSYINQAAQKILQTKRDLDFPNIIHLSMPQHIPDRTDFLIGIESENPAIIVAEQANFLAHMGNQLDKDVLACIACDTFHANAIWQPFYKSIEHAENLHIIHMVDETIADLTEQLKPPAKIAIFGTLGNMKEKTYESRLIPLGYEIVPLTPQQQADIHKAIYDPKEGLKAHSHKTDFSFTLVHNVVSMLEKKNVSKIILACTELSMVISAKDHDMFLDPMLSAANRLVHLYEE